MWYELSGLCRVPPWCQGPTSIKIRSNFDRNAQASIKMHKIARICSKFVQTCAKFEPICPKFDQIGSKFEHIYSTFDHSLSTCDRHAQICSKTSKSVFRALMSSLFEGSRFSKIDKASLRQCFTNEPHAKNSRLSLPDATWRSSWALF